MSKPLCRVCDAETDGFLCRSCGAEITAALGDMKSLTHELSNVATGQTHVYRANGAPDSDAERREDPEAHLNPFLRSPHGATALKPTALVVNLPARELLWQAGNTLSSWARDLAEQKDATIPDDWLTWLTDQSQSMRFSEDAEQAHDELTYLHRLLVKAVDRSPSPLYAGPCHARTAEPVVTERGGTMYVQIVTGRCQRDLYVWPGQLEIVCDGRRGDETGCGAVHLPADRRDWLLAAIEDALLPLATWQQALPKMFPSLKWPPRQTWWRWADGDGKWQRLFSPQQDRNGVDLYAGGHVMDVVRAAQRQLATRGGDRRSSA